MDRRSTRHRLTRLGWQIMLIGMFGILGGSLNGLNLLIVVAAMCIATLMAQWRVSRAMINMIRVDRRLPAEVFAGKPTRMRYQVRNHHVLMPLWLIRLDDVFQRVESNVGDAITHAPQLSGTGRLSKTGRLSGTGRFSDSGRSALSPTTESSVKLVAARFSAVVDHLSQKTFRWIRSQLGMTPKLPASQLPQRTFTGIGALMPGNTTSAYYDFTIHQRGRYQFGSWRVSTTAPFALSTAWRDSATHEAVMDVYPKLFRLQRSWLRHLPSRIGDVSAVAQRQGVSDDVFFGLREYRHGDSPRHIHWRTTARLGEPAVRQFEQQRRFDICLLVDAWSPSSDTFPPEADVERAISLAATVIVELSTSVGSSVVLAIAGRELVVVSGGTSREGLRRMLQSLARVTPSENGSIDQTLAQAAQAAQHLPDLLVVSPRSQKQVVKSSQADGEALRRWQQRSQVNWVDVSSRDASKWIASEVR